jgi:hypothetical protein
MKIFSSFGLICLAFFAIIVLSIGAPVPQAYSMERNMHQGSAYEGFSSIHPLQYTTFPENASLDSMIPNNIAPSSGDGQFKVSGYSGLLTSPEMIHKPLDIYSQATSSTTCQSYGLTNSTGNLCLNPEQLRLLRTRGGNLTGGDSQIGNS